MTSVTTQLETSLDASASVPVSAEPVSATVASRLALAVGIAAVVSALTVALYHFFAAPALPRFATIDLAEVVAVREMQAMVEAARSGGDPQASLKAATQWPAELERTLAAIQNECRCILLVRAAVVASQMTDLTPELKRRMGLDRLDAADLRRTLGNALFQSPRNAVAPFQAPAPGLAPSIGAPTRPEVPHERNARP